MVHKFVQLLKLHKNLTQLSVKELAEWTETLLQQQDGPKILINGIFDKLHNQGELNTDELIYG